jgi:predicted lipase
MRNPVDTDPEVKKDIERLTQKIIENCIDAKNNKRLPYYLLCKYHYANAVAEVKAKKYKDIMIVDFPKTLTPIHPVVEAKCMEVIEKMVSIGTGKVIYATEKKLLWDKLQDLCA